MYRVCRWASPLWARLTASQRSSNWLTPWNNSSRPGVCRNFNQPCQNNNIGEHSVIQDTNLNIALNDERRTTKDEGPIKYCFRSSSIVFGLVKISWLSNYRIISIDFEQFGEYTTGTTLKTASCFSGVWTNQAENSSCTSCCEGDRLT